MTFDGQFLYNLYIFVFAKYNSLSHFYFFCIAKHNRNFDLGHRHCGVTIMGDYHMDNHNTCILQDLFITLLLGAKSLVHVS